MSWIVWDMINEETRERIRTVMPKRWRPPRSYYKERTMKPTPEDINQVDRIMRERPHSPRRVV